MADDMGYGDLACINGGLNRTPNLDRLHANSLRLSQAYAASPVCAPSRAGALTGLYPFRTGCVDLNDRHGLNRLDPSAVTLADVFKREGYRTGLVGKWHCGTDSASRPENRGFDEVRAFHPAHKDFWDWTITNSDGTEVAAEGRYLTDYLTECAVDFIERNHQRPFFLHLAHYAPHRPLQAPSALVERYARDGRLTPGQAVVYSMIEVMDDGIGQVLRTLEKHGILENTIVVFTSDNGPDDVDDGCLSPRRFNCGLRGQKYSVHEGGIRVPFLVQWPSVLQPATNDDFFHFVDILPTLAASCSLDLPAGLALDGINRLPVWLGGREPYPRSRFWQWNRYYPADNCNAAMRDGRWKLVIPARDGYRDMAPEEVAMIRDGTFTGATPPARNRDSGLGAPLPPLLFDIGTDPGETRNMAEEQRPRMEAMQASLSSWFREVRGQLDAILDGRFPTIPDNERE